MQDCIEVTMQEQKLEIGLRFPLGNQRIWWRILDIDEEKQKALVIADKTVCDMQYHKKVERITWDKCYIRAWLNQGYLNRTFSEEEQESIAESRVETPDLEGEFLGKHCHLEGGEPVNDRIFLLSIEEAKKYFKDDEDRACGYMGHKWWLRSPGFYSNAAAEIDSDGGIFKGGRSVHFQGGIRPAFWIDLNSRFFQSRIYHDLDGNTIVKLPAFCSVKSEVIQENISWEETVALPIHEKGIASSAALFCRKPCSDRREAEPGMTVERACYRYCPRLRLPEKLYQTEKKLSEDLAPYIPDDPETAAYVLTYQKDRILWAVNVIHNSGEQRILELADRMAQIKWIKPDAIALLASAPYADMYKIGDVDVSEYKHGASNGYRRSRTAEMVADRIGRRELAEILRNWIQSVRDSYWYAPYAVYADEDQIRELIKTMKTWEKEGKVGKERIIRVRGAILLNDTREAMRYADSQGLLGRYAKLRGRDEDTIRDKILSDFGLNTDGKKNWELARKKFTASLNSDLSVTLSDENGKELKTLPKRGADPEAYETACREFASLKREIKATAKIRNDRIFSDFLSGRSRPGKDWKDTYMQNPLLKILAGLIVWEQGKKTFILKEGGNAYDVNGDPYSVTDEQIIVAHPMEMGKEETKAWQLYFNRNQLKQPFEQIWEPVIDASLVQEGRYDGCTIELYRLMNREKHGIIINGQHELKLPGCSAELKLVEESKEWVHNKFEIKHFRYSIYNRQVNHIVAHFDKGTVEGRILKDDVTVRMWLDIFTPAQISEFIGLAVENGCTNVAALLLEYQNEHFIAFDPMEEFTLDLL